MTSEVSVYSALDGNAQAVARKAAAHIAGIQHRLVTDIVEIGRTLLQVMEAVGHGNFLPWLKVEFDWTERTAQNFMSVAERFGSNPKCVSHLPLNTVYRLAAPSTPDVLREQIVERLENGEDIKPIDVGAAIAEARKQAKRDREAAKKTAARTPEAKAKAEKARKRAEAYYAKQRAEADALSEQRRSKLREVTDIIVAGLTDDALAAVLKLMFSNYSPITYDALIEARGRMRVGTALVE